MQLPSAFLAGTSVRIRNFSPVEAFMATAPGDARRFLSAHSNGLAPLGIRRSRSAGIRNPGMNRQGGQSVLVLSDSSVNQPRYSAFRKMDLVIDPATE